METTITTITTTMSELKELCGLFEVHLITKPEYETQLFGFITDLANSRTDLIRPRPTCAHALYGDYPVQPMLTFWTKGKINEVRKTVNEIHSQMESRKIPIIRSKIEAMAHNEGTPLVCSDGHYFEYHFKITNLTGTKDWDKVVKLIAPYGGHLFYNPYNKSLTPIATIRRYSNLDELDTVFIEVKKLLESNSFTIDTPEKEFSVDDSNVNLDHNWLFTGSPTNFITEVQPQMLFATS